MKNKRNTLKILGVGALCLTTALGFVGCGNKADKSDSKTANVSATEARTMYESALDKFVNNTDGYWDNLELIVTIDADSLGRYTLSTGVVDDVNTSVEYESESSYTIYQKDNETSQTICYEKTGISSYNKKIEGANLVMNESIFAYIKYANISAETFKSAKFDSNNNYVLTFVSSNEDSEEGWSEGKTYTLTTTYEICINSQNEFVRANYKAEITGYSSAVTNEDKETMENWEYEYKFEFNYNKAFDSNTVKAMLDEIKSNVG